MVKMCKTISMYLIIRTEGGNGQIVDWPGIGSKLLLFQVSGLDSWSSTHCYCSIGKCHSVLLKNSLDFGLIPEGKVSQLLACSSMVYLSKFGQVSVTIQFIQTQWSGFTQSFPFARSIIHLEENLYQKCTRRLKFNRFWEWKCDNRSKFVVQWIILILKTNKFYKKQLLFPLRKERMRL